MIDIKRDINERTQIEDILRREKAFTESALNSLQDLFYVFDLNGRFLRWNKSFSAITGYSDKEISTKKPTDFFLGEDVHRISNAIEMVMKNGTTSIEAELVTKNGGRINYEFNGTLLKDYDGEPLGICGVGRNISKRKSMELEYKTILNSAMDGFYVTDSQGHILDVNDSYCSLIGYSREELLNMGIKDIDAIDSEEMIAERIQRILKVGWERFETRHKCKDGRIVEIESSVNYDEAGGGKFFVFMRDITERNKVQKGYTESEARLSEAQRIAHIGNWEWNIKTNELYWSEENYRIFGLSRDIRPSVEGFLNTVHPDDLKFVQKSMDDALHGRPYDIDMHIIRPDGQERIVNAKAEVCFDGKNQPIKMSGTVQDITERKQKEENLRLFRYLIDKSNDAITIVNSETGIILDANEKASSCLGYSRDELLNMHVYDFEVTLPDNFSWKQHVKEIKKKGSLFLEGKHRRKDGTIFPVEVSVKLHEYGNKSRLVAVARDITEHKRFVEMVTESEERFHSITQSANDAIITADSKGDIIFWNYSAHNLFGYRDEEVTGKHLTFLMPERYRDAHQTGMERFLATGVPHVIGKTVELSGLRKDGSEILIELSLSTWKTGDKVFYSGILRDITERKLAEEKIRKSLVEKEVLLREIHHRVKNNMQIVSSLLRLQSQNIEDKKYKEMFVDSQTRIFSMGLIHEKLYQSESIAQINFKEYINGIVSNIFESYGLRNNIKFYIKAENIPIKIDYAVPCGLIINELVTNSIKYAFPDERQGKIQILLKSNDNNIQLSISDDGIGIPKELDIRNTKSLGLHLVTALAEGQLHGKIILNRERGTEFQISFSAK